MLKDFSTIFPSDQPVKPTNTLEHLRSSVSQHTKEIAVINTTLADMKKDKISTSFKEKIDNFMVNTEQRIDRLSTSMKLLTKQIFQNDSTMQNKIDSSISKTIGNQQAQANAEIVSVLEKTMEDIKTTQKNILERLNFIENNKQKAQKKQVRFAKSNILIFDIEPMPFDIENVQNSQSFAQISDFVKQKMKELDEIRSTQDENNTRFGKFIQVSEDTMNKLNGEINSTKMKLESEISKVYANLEKYMTREEIVLLMQESSLHTTQYSRGKKLSRPVTAITRSNGIEAEHSLTTMSIQMISGDSITRPSTTQGRRLSPNKRGRPKI